MHQSCELIDSVMEQVDLDIDKRPVRVGVREAMTAAGRSLIHS